MQRNVLVFWLSSLLISSSVWADPKAPATSTSPTPAAAPTGATPSAMPGPPRFPFDTCKEDIQRYCPAEKEERAIGKCLFQHDKEVRDVCKESLERMIQMSKQAAARGGGALGSFGGMSLMAASVASLSYSGTLSPETSGPALTDQRLNFSAPVFHDREQSLSASFAAGAIHFNDPINLSSGIAVPQGLYRMEVGGQYTHQLADKKNWGLRGSVGYAGDKLFQNISDTTFSVSGNYGFPGSGNGYWVVSVFLANNSPLINYVPIPGVLYLYRTEHFTGVFGFPILSMQWTPTEYWSYSISFFGPTMNSEVAYGKPEDGQSFLGASWIQQYFLRDGRAQSNYRLTLDEKKVFLGFRMPLYFTLIGELQVGEALDRAVYEGKGFLNRDGGAYTMGNSWFTTLNLKAIF